MISFETLMEQFAYLACMLGIVAFLVAIVVQVIKELPGLKALPTSVVALVVSIALTMVTVIVYCILQAITMTWYYYVGAFVASFIVYLVATGGWERIHEIWERTKYNKK